MCFCFFAWILSRELRSHDSSFSTAMAHLFPPGSPGPHGHTATSPRALELLSHPQHDVTSPAAATLSRTPNSSTTIKQLFPPSTTTIPPTIAAANYTTANGDNNTCTALKAARDLAAPQTAALHAAAAAAASELYQLEEALRPLKLLRRSCTNHSINPQPQPQRQQPTTSQFQHQQSQQPATQLPQLINFYGWM